MFDAKPDLTFTFHSSQRERFRDGTLVSQWRSKYPELFDDDDVRVLKTDHQRTYHFFEWLSAILLFEATGCISLLETYLAKSHRRKRATVKKIVPKRVFGWMDRHKTGQPDLFVYCPETHNWFFCEVKGGSDRVSDNQREWLAGFTALLKKEALRVEDRVQLIQLVEGRP